MSVTVADLLKLPCLREAKLIAGEKGLIRIVSSISVLEYAEVTSLHDALFKNNAFYGSEIVISGLINIKDDVAAQCANIRRLSEVGEVGLILYYVGIFLPCIDQQVIDLANELNFALICMPENRLDLRYSEVICEVMEAIFKDQMLDTHFVSEILERISVLPIHQQSIDTVLKMLSDRIRASCILTDNTFSELNAASWPRTLSLAIDSILPQLDFLQKENPSVLDEPDGKKMWVCKLPITNDKAPNMHLFILKEQESLSMEIAKQAAEVVQIAVNIWSHNHGQLGTSELVQAILKDEPMKMRRLAEFFNIDVASIHTMWVLKANKDFKNRGDKLDYNEQVLSGTKDFLNSQFGTLIADIYSGSVVVFMDDPLFSEDPYLLAQLLREDLLKKGLDLTLTLCFDLATTRHVREAYLAITNAFTAARTIYPQKFIFSLQEIQFATSCNQIIDQGEEAIAKNLSVLAPLEWEEGDQNQDLRHTLAVYLLDAHSNVARTGELLYVHKNTIKYRLQRINKKLNYPVTKMPEAFSLYRAVALERLLH